MEGAGRASYAKLEAYAARFALVRHCVRQAAGEKELEYIDATDIDAGVLLARWFGQETLRVYRLMSESDEDRERRELLKWIADHGGKVTVRDLQRWSTPVSGQSEPSRVGPASAGGLWLWFMGACPGWRARR